MFLDVAQTWFLLIVGSSLSALAILGYLTRSQTTFALPPGFAHDLSRALYSQGLIVRLDEEDADENRGDLLWRCVSCPNAATLEAELNHEDNDGWRVEDILALPGAKGFLLVMSIEKRDSVHEDDEDEVTEIDDAYGDPVKARCWLNDHEYQGDYPADPEPRPTMNEALRAATPDDEPRVFTVPAATLGHDL